MKSIDRRLAPALHHHLKRGKSILILGPRQTGKTTLMETLAADRRISLVAPDERIRYEKSPGLLQAELADIRPSRRGKRPLVVIDEIQKVPDLLDSVQDLIDRLQAQFVLTGSSARKLRHGVMVNLLPGRLVTLRLDPLTTTEIPSQSLDDHLRYGSLPGIARVASKADREADLASYATTYLEEEVRAEAIVRRIGTFARFLECAALESGKIVNFRSVARDLGVSHTTVAAFYEILEDCLIVERIEPITRSASRKKLTHACRYLFFDLGVRRLIANEGIRLTPDRSGEIFEQFVGLELIRLSRAAAPKTTVHFWRDPDGPEVDWVLARDGELIPIEVKYSETPRPTDARHLEVFLREYREARRGYIICRTPRSFQLTPRIRAIPWQELSDC